ncbi:hypothetical protein KRE40_16665 [Elizabethkingia meningoseptica]|uniref:DUF6850 family outer membrane beta-barrel protein n=1 Tax=Elizabethkingia meningoseptica TaxID=238 RepID=UPI0023AF4183|nr:DUF6850 family outer membrane beta-barrel protein [Elizabethkingia meningoseptica]MDE5439601.1 hypothetical protein [Elizabethkingia meningoseptica]MDE5510270.1 hypothetical protein [Elizabethkingia meningoseptica]MDE5517419.1 hypothetical protein [Elizabethkingia meningoseptica]MDE5528034.1 hypothetical protein [Elizabethkingia meningoseptica]MDE5531510.1 hypothetical protein [Elizabethkingia meningoseptica]
MHNKNKSFFNFFISGMTGLATLSSQLLFSQSTHLDSINISTVEKEIRVENPYISFFQPLDFSRTNFKYEINKQNFKRVQSPDKIQSFIFNSDGVYRLSQRVVLSGRLQAERTTEDEVPYILNDERTTNSSFIYNPSYFWAPRAAKWLKQNYLISGQIAYRPVKPIIAQFGAEGNFAKSYRQNADPRPKVDNYKYNIFSKIGYNWRQHSVFAKGKYINHFKKNDIMFVSKNANVPANDSIYIRYNEGYGNPYRDSEFRDSEYKKDGYVWGGEYAFNTSNTHISVGYDYLNIIERFYKKYEYTDANDKKVMVFNKYSGLKTDLHSFYINYLGNFSGYKMASRLIYQDQLDANYNYVSQYTSYRLEQQNLHWNNSLVWFNHKNEAYKLLLDLGYGKNRIQDISVVMDRKLSFFEYHAGVEKEFAIAPAHKMAVGLGQSLYVPIKKNFNYVPYQSSKENVFVQRIAKPDYAYDSTPKIGLNINAAYRWDNNKIRYELTTGFMQLWLTDKTYKETNTEYNGRPNTVASVGLNVYY